MLYRKWLETPLRLCVYNEKEILKIAFNNSVLCSCHHSCFFFQRIAIWTKAPKIPVKSISRGVLKPITQSPMLNKKQNHQQSTLGSTYSKLKEVECDERNILAQPSSSRSKPVNKSATKRAASRTISDTGSPDTRGSKLKKQPKIVQTEPNWRGVVLRNSSSVRRKKTGTQEADTKKSFKSAIKSSPLLRRKPSAKEKKVANGSEICEKSTQVEGLTGSCDQNSDEICSEKVHEASTQVVNKFDQNFEQMGGHNSEKSSQEDFLVVTREQNNGELCSGVHAASTHVAIKSDQNAEQIGDDNSEKRTKVDVLILTGEQNNGKLCSEVLAASTQVAIKGDQNAEQMGGDNSEKRTKVEVLILTGEQNNGELCSEVHAASTQVAIKGDQNAEQMGGVNSEKRTKAEVLILTGEQNNGELCSEVHAASTQVAIKGDQNAELMGGDNSEKRTKVEVLILTGEQNNGELCSEVHAASTQVAIKGDQNAEQMGGVNSEKRTKAEVLILTGEQNNGELCSEVHAASTQVAIKGDQNAEQMNGDNSEKRTKVDVLILTGEQNNGELFSEVHAASTQVAIKGDQNAEQMNGDNSEKKTKVDVLIFTGEQNNGELFSEVHAASTQVAIKGDQNAEQMNGDNSEKRAKVDVLILTGEQNNGELFSEVHAASTQVAIKGYQNAEQMGGYNSENRTKVDVLILTGEQNNGELFSEVHAASTQVAIKGDQNAEQMGGDIFEERRQVQGFTSNASGQKSDQMEIELEKSAHKIQTWWRGRKQRIKYLRLRSMTLHIQAFARGYLERSSLFDDKRAGDTLYRYYLNAVKNSGVENLESLGSHSVQLKYFVEKKAAYKIADYLKCLLKSRQARDEFIAKRRAAVVIQNAFRNYKSIKAARLYLNLVREKKNQEMVAERKKTEEKAAILIQKGLRSYINTKQTRNRFIVQKCAAIIIQRAVRAFFTRKRYIEIQQRRRLSANVISSWYRARREICVERRNYRLKIEKIVQLQSLVRGYLFRKELKRRTEAAIVIQAKIRSNLQRRNFLKLKSACMKIQRIFRDKQADKLHEHEIYLEKVVLAQNCVRKFIARKKFERMCSVIEPVKKSFVEIRSAIIIQRKFRKVRGKLLLRYYTTRLHRSALKIQRLWRGYCLRRDLDYFRENVITIQRAYRNYKECKDLKIELETKMKSVIKIQSVCRGFIVRKNFNLPKMKQAVKVIWKFYTDNKEGYIQRRTELRAAIKIQVSIERVSIFCPNP